MRRASVGLLKKPAKPLIAKAKTAKAEIYSIESLALVADEIEMVEFAAAAA